MQKTRQVIVYLTVAILLFLSVYTYFQFQEYKKYTRYVEHTYQVMNAMERLEGNVSKLMAWRRGYVIAPTDILKDLIFKGRVEVLSAMDTLERLVSDNALQADNVSQIRQLIAPSLEQPERWFALSEGPARIDSMKTDVWKVGPQMDDVFKILAQMKDIEERFLKVRSFFQKDTGAALPLMLLITGLTAISMMVYAFYVMEIEMKASIKAKEALEKNVQQLNVANEELERFAFIASHNLKEPLRKARTFISRTLPSVDANGALYPNLHKVEQSLGRLQSMLDDLLVFTNISHHRENKEQIDLHKIIRAVMLEYKESIAATNAEINIDQLPEISGYPYQITLIFRHLFSNALKYRKLGHPLLVRISGMRDVDSRHQVVVFSDNGIGFEEAYSQKIFEVFGRLHSQDDYEGTGIGLAICRRVMSNHSGFIAAESLLGNGASFRLYFPVEE